ncbi:Splicing factor [Malassezia yamatoensis]|uniref:U4/U6 snRNA-associated-splicing factor PRP24 n=1 Tax=Malassezia yamatoensis TaxID=253288 RepID=A0AAJ6CIR3_9BASI|nr:Splicing factor [Malassezia yamatoensis]
MVEAPTLDPWRYQGWIRSIQCKLLASEDPTSLISEFIQAYSEASEHVALRPTDWHIYLSIATQKALNEEQPSNETMQDVIQLHKSSLQDSMDSSLHLRFASLVLCLYSACHREQNIQDVYEIEDQVTDITGKPYELSNLVKNWTKLDESPKLSSNGMYAKPESLGKLVPMNDEQAGSELSVDATRSRLREIYAHCAFHTKESGAVWRLYHGWEVSLLKVRYGVVTKTNQSQEQLELIKQAYLARLQIPHDSIEDTFQSYSQFVSTYFPVEQYEELLASANKLYGEALQMWHSRERYEAAVNQEFNSLDQWMPYLSWESHKIKTLRTSKDKAHLATEEELGAALYRRALHRFGWYPLGQDEKEERHLLRPPTPAEEKAWNGKKGRKSNKMIERERHLARVNIRAQCATRESLWLDYAALIAHTSSDSVHLLDVCENATRVLPSSGQLWALYMRTLVHCQRPRAQFDDLYHKVRYSGTLQECGGAKALIPFLQAHIDGERNLATMEVASAQHTSPEEVALYADLDQFMHIYELLVEAVSQVSPLRKEERDASYALEFYTVDWIERAARALSAAAGPEAAASLYPLAQSVWENATQGTSSPVQAYLGAAEYFARHDDNARARHLFRTGANVRNSDENKLPVLERWVQFEHARGSMAQIETAESRLKSESDRIWRQWYKSMYSNQAIEQGTTSSYSASNGVDSQTGPVESGQFDSQNEANIGMESAMQPTTQPTLQSVSHTSPETDTKPAQSPMRIESEPQDAPADSILDSSSTSKRKADDLMVQDLPGTESKKNRTEVTPPSRDREFSSIMVSNLPPHTQVSDLLKFFKECDGLLEVVGPRPETTADGKSPSSSAAQVEFQDREAAAAARTRDLKRIEEHEVHIAPSYLCTLYVTNFPPETNDEQIRELFGKYGSLFDVRWPSRKFVQSRRFCYVQYTKPDYAQAALVEHGKQWTDEFALQVFLSNPSHKKQRTDANANERELYMTGLPRNAQKEQIKSFFEQHAPVEEVRLPLRPDGKSRGIAFISFYNAIEARRAMQATNSTRFLGRLVAVMLSEAGRKSSGPKPEDPQLKRARSVVVSGLPQDAQEAVIQQVIEKALGRNSVQRVFWTPARHDSSATADSLVELQDAETAGRALLLANLDYDGHPLRIEPRRSFTDHALTPRTASRGRGRGRGGALGFARVHNRERTAEIASQDNAHNGQDKFRALLYK